MGPMNARFDPKRILIILHGSIGDVTRALPLANLIHRGFPNASLTWAVEPASLPLVEGHPALDEVIVFDRSQWWRSFGPFLRCIRSRKFDLALDLQRHLKSGIISWWSGARDRVGFNHKDCKELNWLFNNHFIAATGDGIAKLDHYLKFAEYLGIEPFPVEWNFKLTVDDESAVAHHLAQVNPSYAVLFAGARWESKRWFPFQIAQCAESIHSRYQLGIVLLGGKEDQNLAGEALGQARVPIANLVGRTSLREALGIIAKAKFAVGPDTGLMHIAAAVQTPVISLWGATSPQRTGPYGFDDLVVQGRAQCVPCYRRGCPIGRICMQSIGIEEIMAKIEKGLARKRDDAPSYDADV